jgi:hypothetical protein
MIWQNFARLNADFYNGYDFFVSQKIIFTIKKVKIIKPDRMFVLN